jgi:hypothetical protein
MIDRNFWVLKETVCIEVPDAQLTDLAASTGYGRLVTFSARLRVIERAKSVGSDVLDFLKEFLISSSPAGVRKTIALVVKTGSGFR